MSLFPKEGRTTFSTVQAIRASTGTRIPADTISVSELQFLIQVSRAAERRRRLKEISHQRTSRKHSLAIEM
jgi:hypothetical protein